MAVTAQSYAPLYVSEGDPAHHAVVVTPSDTDDLVNASTALWVTLSAAASILKVNMLGGETVTFTFANAAASATPLILPLRVTRVWSTTTANVTNIIALWR